MRGPAREPQRGWQIGALRQRANPQAPHEPSHCECENDEPNRAGLAAAGCELGVSDIVAGRRQLAASLGARWIDPADAMEAECEVLAPCALGGAISAANATRLRCEIVCGSANNQLADESLAGLLAERGILYAPDFIANAGGLIHVYREIKGYSEERAVALAEGIEQTLKRCSRPPPSGGVAARGGARTRRANASARSCETERMEALWVLRAGLVGYQEARRMQAAFERARGAGGIPDVVLMLEHPPVYTKGRRATAGELPMGEDWYRMQGIEVVATDRGGQVTYHGPGQLVAYPILSLRELARPDDVHAYVRHWSER